MNKKHLETSIFSFFAGSGLLDLGFEAANFNVVYASEISPAFMKAYSYARKCIGIAYPKHGCHTGEDGDITNILKTSHIISDLLKEERKSSKIIGFLGGSPCPDFSIGGKNRGQEGEHGKLSGSYIELICLHQPDFFVFENVKGLWKTKRHRDFYEGLKFKLYKTGYILTERLINAIEYGVPQDRERVILIGFSKFFLNSLGFKTINLNYISEKEFPWKNYINYNKDKIFSCAWPERSPFIEDSIFDCPDNLPQELTVEYWFRKNDVFHHPNSVHCFQPRAGLKRFMSVDEGDDSKKSYKRLHRWRYSPTACYGNNEVHIHPYKARRISVAEALAIQSLPREFSLPDSMSLTNMFKTIGNGVPYLASKAIADTISDFFDSSELNLNETIDIQTESKMIFI